MKSNHRENAKRANRPNPREDKIPRLIVDNTPKTVSLLPRNLAQESYLELLEDDLNDIIISTGPAGCGKTYLATLFAIRAFMRGEVKKIVVTRPLVANGENIGALPGDLMAKLAPWCVPVLDIFKEIFPVSRVKAMLEDETIELASLGLMRGRTFKNTFVIADEMQNATTDQVKMVMTRIGENSRMVLTGDVNQHDRALGSNGLKDLLSRLSEGGTLRVPEGLATAQFNRDDVERHRVIGNVLKLYGE